jgi:hypothetical protein
VAGHAVGLDGKCVLCDAMGGCWLRVVALGVLDANGVLPRRREGASRPDRLFAIPAQRGRRIA